MIVVTVMKVQLKITLAVIMAITKNIVRTISSVALLSLLPIHVHNHRAVTLRLLLLLLSCTAGALIISYVEKLLV